jgi:hypothetical protein
MEQYQDIIDLICRVELELKDNPRFQHIAGELPRLWEAACHLNTMLDQKCDPEQQRPLYFWIFRARQCMTRILRRYHQYRS